MHQVMLPSYTPDSLVHGCAIPREYIAAFVSIGICVLSGVGAVVHQQQLDVTDVADEEGLVAGGGQEAGLLVGTVADLKKNSLSDLLLVSFEPTSCGGA